MAKYSDNRWRQFVDISRALADESRIKILVMLNIAELCVCQITSVLGLAPSTVSKHLFILQSAGLIRSRKKGRWIYYSLDTDGGKSAQKAIKHVIGSVDGYEMTAEIARAVKDTLTVDPDLLCRRLYGDGR